MLSWNILAPSLCSGAFFKDRVASGSALISLGRTCVQDSGFSDACGTPSVQQGCHGLPCQMQDLHPEVFRWQRRAAQIKALFFSLAPEIVCLQEARSFVAFWRCCFARRLRRSRWKDLWRSWACRSEKTRAGLGTRGALAQTQDGLRDRAARRQSEPIPRDSVPPGLPCARRQVQRPAKSDGSPRKDGCMVAWSPQIFELVRLAGKRAEGRRFSLEGMPQDRGIWRRVLCISRVFLTPLRRVFFLLCFSSLFFLLLFLLLLLLLFSLSRSLSVSCRQHHFCYDDFPQPAADGDTSPSGHAAASDRTGSSLRFNWTWSS